MGGNNNSLCQVVGCNNSSNEEISMHNISNKSKNEEKNENNQIRSSRWLHNLKRKDSNIDVIRPQICSEHFQIQCFKLKDDYTISKYLRNTAVPSILPTIDHHLSDISNYPVDDQKWNWGLDSKQKAIQDARCVKLLGRFQFNQQHQLLNREPANGDFIIPDEPCLFNPKCIYTPKIIANVKL